MSHSHKADLAILTLTTLVAIGWVTSQLGTGIMPPLLFTGIRLTVSALVLVVASIVWFYAVSLSSQIGESAFITSTKTLLVPFIVYFLFKIVIPR